MAEIQDRVQSVVAAHRILATLGEAKSGLSLAGLSRALGMTPPRVLRHLTTLTELGLVERTGTDPCYRLGIELVRLGERALVQHDLTRIAYSRLRLLSDRHGQATFLVRPQEQDVVVLLSMPSNDIPHLTMPPGMTFSYDGSACGRVMLAFRGDDPPPPPHGASPSGFHPDPLAGPEALEQRLAQIRARFFDYFGMNDANAVYSLAAPVLDHREQAVAAIGIVGFSMLFRARKQVLVTSLLEAARQLSGDLGSGLAWPPPPDVW